MRSSIRFTGLFLAMLLSLAPLSRAQEDADGEKDEGKKHYLTFQVSYFGSAHRASTDGFLQSETSIEVNDRFSGRIEMRPTTTYDLPSSVAAQTARMQAMQAAMAAGDAKALQATTPPLLVTWFPRGSEVEITGAIWEVKRTNSSNREFGESRAKSDTATESYSGQKVFMANFGNAFVKIRAEEKLYDLQFSIMPDMAATWDAVHQTLVSEHKEVGHDRHTGSEAEVPLDMGPSQFGLGYSNYQIAAEVKDQPFGSDEGELTGTTRIPVPKPAGWEGDWNIAMLVSWQLEITPSPYRLEIEVVREDYAKWRPTTASPEADPGESFQVKARVVSNDGTVPTVKVAQFEWLLQDTSKEPGVALNYPVNAADQRFDLELDAGGSGVVRSETKQRLVRTAPGGLSDQVDVVPFDWGGWATVQVTAVLEGGRRLTGRVKGELDAGLRVPKRAPDSHIADSWKKKKGAGGADRSDEDNAPVGDGTKGDGLTLYEEYRGFFENAVHIEGDPKTKDFFIRVKDAGIALPGIAKFQKITKLKVHFAFTEQEFPESRVINANRDRGANRTDQHGVIIQVNKDLKGYAIARGITERPGNPKSITVVDLMADAAGKDPRWLASTVAHELGHCVNLWHHGESDNEVNWTVRDGQLFEEMAGVGMAGIGLPVVAVDEGMANRTAEMIGLINALPGKTLPLWLGRIHGQHSGHDNCMMRYDCGEIYIFRPRPNYRVMLINESEPTGHWICSSPAGVGVNLPGRNPIDRYGAAAEKRGDCEHQILVTDEREAPGR